MKPWIWLDKQPIPSESAPWIQSRAFRYGDGVFETMRVQSGKVLFPELHFQRLQKGIAVLGLQVPQFHNYLEWLDILNELLRLNNIRKGGKIRFQVYRSGIGLDLPITDEAGVSIICDELLQNKYAVRQPISACIAQSVQIHPGLITQIKSANRLHYIMAAREAKQYNKDTSFILNSQGHIVDSVSANICVLDENGIFLIPSSKFGALPGVMVENVKSILNQMDYKVQDNSISIQQLQSAQQVFICNVISGILPIASVSIPNVGVISYKTALAAQITQKL